MGNATQWFQAYLSLDSIVEGMSPAEVKYHTLDDTRQVLRDLKENEHQFNQDFQKSIELLRPFLRQFSSQDAKDLRNSFRDTVNDWQENLENAPSTVALLAAFYHLRGYQPSDNPSMKSSLMTAVLATIPHENGYHSNAHFREVLFGGMVLLVQEEFLVNNKHLGFGEGGHHYSENYTCDVMRVKLEHDLWHSGKNNKYTIDGQLHRQGHQPFYLERLPIEGSSGYLRHCGLSEEKITNDNTVILCSDVSKGDDNKKLKYSGSEYLRQLSRHHSGQGRLKQQNFPKSLQLLLSDERNPEIYGELTRGQYLASMAERLNDADLLVNIYHPESAAMRYLQLRKELPDVFASNPGDQTFVGFLRHAYGGVVRDGTFVPQCHSPAARKLFEPEMQAVFAAAKQALPRTTQQQLNL